MSLASFGELGRALLLVGELELEKHHAMEKACTIIEDSAKGAIGTYEFGWQQLAQSTQEQRVALGFSPNDPLLRTGELRDSIGHTVESGNVGYIGTNNKIAPYQEFGTDKIPPRPFLGGALAAKGQEAADCFGVEISAKLSGKSAP